jgi:hypothetical protein
MLNFTEAEYADLCDAAGERPVATFTRRLVLSPGAAGSRVVGATQLDAEPNPLRAWGRGEGR